ncbi:NIF family HAD-type phosphatase [Achromobacter piechaudii]|uniref:NIF family HAD-type phosphatase n=1 Tax=Achromobacter piechaudii TaxID=72556 RepID=UPI001C2EE29D|nr:NIF family HAD-type phosphatase [Achromobacter piechaudii]
MSQIPRPGLLNFLERCRELLPRIVVFTTVNESRFRAIADLLIQEHAAPAWFAQLEYVSWAGATKDLALIPNAAAEDCLLLDDFEAYVHPGQHAQWICIESFAHPYEASDTELT